MQRVYNKRSNEVINGKAKLPTAEQLEYGEIAINYAKGKETLAIKNDEDEIVKLPFTGGSGDSNIRYVRNSDVNPFSNKSQLYDYIRRKRENGDNLYEPENGCLFVARVVENGVESIYPFVNYEPSYDSIIDPVKTKTQKQTEEHKKITYDGKFVVRKHFPERPMEFLRYYFQGEFLLFEVYIVAGGSATYYYDTGLINDIDILSSEEGIRTFYKRHHNNIVVDRNTDGVRVFSNTGTTDAKILIKVFPNCSNGSSDIANVVFLTDLNSYLGKKQNWKDEWRIIKDKEFYINNDTFYFANLSQLTSEPETISPHLKIRNQHVVNIKPSTFLIRKRKIIDGATLMGAKADNSVFRSLIGTITAKDANKHILVKTRDYVPLYPQRGEKYDKMVVTAKFECGKLIICKGYYRGKIIVVYHESVTPNITQSLTIDTAQHSSSDPTVLIIEPSDLGIVSTYFYSLTCIGTMLSDSSVEGYVGTYKKRPEFHTGGSAKFKKKILTPWGWIKPATKKKMYWGTLACVYYNQHSRHVSKKYGRSYDMLAYKVIRGVKSLFPAHIYCNLRSRSK